MNDLLEAFGITKDDLNEDNRKGEQKGKKGKKTTHSSKKEKMFSFPICFNAGHLRHVFTDDQSTETKQWSEKILKKNLEDEFPELKGICYDLISVKNENQSEIVTARIVYKKLDEVDKIEFPAKIVAGEISVPIISAESVQDIEKVWSEEYPEYRDCNFHYIPSSRFLIPYMEPNCPEGKQYEFPITVGYLDIKETYTQDDFRESNCSLEQIRKKYAESYTEFEDCEFAYQEELNLLFPIMKTNEEEKE